MFNGAIAAGKNRQLDECRSLRYVLFSVISPARVSASPLPCIRSDDHRQSGHAKRLMGQFVRSLAVAGEVQTLAFSF
jgi:hypothetical protein